MESIKHIHIISGEESIHKTFTRAIDEFKMSKAIIIVEMMSSQNRVMDIIH